MKSFSVVIPVYNAEQTIQKVVEVLLREEAFLHKIILVDDGSTDNTPTLLRKLSASHPSSIRILSQPHGGVARARNVGAAIVSSPLLLFLGADTIPQPHLLRRHVAVHHQYPAPHVACVGFVTWDPILPPSPFMVFLEHGGPQNAFDMLAGKEWVDARQAFFGSNISLKTTFFSQGKGFRDTSFSEYGWEDLEYGFRFQEQGGQLFYEPTARVFHHHPQTLLAVERRMKNIGKGAVELERLHPGSGAIRLSREQWASPLRRILFFSAFRRVLLQLAVMEEKQRLLPSLFQRVLSLSFYDGVQEAVRKKEKSVDNNTKETLV